MENFSPAENDGVISSSGLRGVHFLVVVYIYTISAVIALYNLLIGPTQSSRPFFLQFKNGLGTRLTCICVHAHIRVHVYTCV